MNPLAPGVIRIPTRGDGDNCFLVEEADGYTLVDVGWKNAPAAIDAVLSDLGRAWRDIRRIVLTHAHPDHVRGLKEAATRSSAEVLIHQDDAAWLAAGRVPSEGRCGALGRALDKVPLLHWEPVAATRTLSDGERVGGLEVIHTPGHSPGHILLSHEPSGSLLVGDAIFNRSQLDSGPNFLAADPAVRDASYRRIPRGASCVGFSHGVPLVRDGVADFDSWLDRHSQHQAGSESPPPIQP